MGYRVCAVYSCRRNSKEKTVNFFSPSNPKQKERWLQSNPDPDGWRKLKNFHVCSRHFASGDMDVDVNGNSFLRNKALACPSVFEFPAKIIRLLFLKYAFCKQICR